MILKKEKLSKVENCAFCGLPKSETVQFWSICTSIDASFNPEVTCGF